MPRFVDATSTPVLLFNLGVLVNKLVASLTTLGAAICHAFGLGPLELALDILVVSLAIGFFQSWIWLIARKAFGIEMERPTLA